MRASRPFARADVTKFSELIRTRMPQVHARVARSEAARLLGPSTQYRQFVDGREGAPLESVRFAGRIVFTVNRLGDVIHWIYMQLVRGSPIGPNTPPHLHYFEDHQIYVNGERVAAGHVVNPPPDAVVTLVDGRDYAAKIERGLSVQAPDGVYEIVAVAARRRFPNVRIVFDYMALPGHKYRYPAITITAEP